MNRIATEKKKTDRKTPKGGSVKKILWLCAVMLLTCGAGVTWWMTGGVEISAGTVENTDLVKVVAEIGTVESKKAIQVAAKSGGEVEAVYASEGDIVKEGDLLLKSDSSATALNVARIQAEASGVRAQYNTAKELADKNKKLYEEGAVSYDTYLQLKTAADQLEAQLSSLTYSADSAIESTGNGQIKAPISGIITQIYAKEGEIIQAGSPVLEISGMDDSYVAANLIAEDVDLVREGMKGKRQS